MYQSVDLQPLSDESQRDVDAWAADARGLLRLPTGADPSTVVSAIARWIEGFRADDGLITNDQRLGAAIRFGCLWGGAVVTAYAWLWREHRQDDGMFLAIVEPRLRYRVYPVPVARAWLDDLEREPNVEALFGILGTMPPAKDGELVTVG